MPTNDYRNYLSHHGILGQKWGVRRYQNADGSLTSKGKNRYGKKEKTPLTAEQKSVRRKKIAKRIGIGAAITTGVLATTGAVLAQEAYLGMKQLSETLPRRLTDSIDRKIYGSPRKRYSTKTNETFLEKSGFTADKFMYDKFEFDTFKPDTFTYDKFKP